MGTAGASVGIPDQGSRSASLGKTPDKCLSRCQDCRWRYLSLKFGHLASQTGAFRSDPPSCPTPPLVPGSPAEGQGSWPSPRGRVIAQPGPDTLVPIESPTAVPYHPRVVEAGRPGKRPESRCHHGGGRARQGERGCRITSPLPRALPAKDDAGDGTRPAV